MSPKMEIIKLKLKMKYIVYCTINLVNNKVFIGVHGTENPEGFDGHLGCGIKTTMSSTFMKPRTPLQYAVKKYGVKNFRRITLYVYDNVEDAYKKEREIVDENFIQQESNYNYVLGGGIDRPTEPIYQFDIDGNLVKKWNTLTEAAEFFNSPIKSFRNAILYKEQLFDYLWSRKDFISKNDYSAKTNRKSVYKYMECGKLIKEWNTLNDCIREENHDIKSLLKAIQEQDLVNGYYYSYSLTDEFKSKPRTNLKKKKFYVYSLEGEFIKECTDFGSLKEFTGVKSFTKLSNALKRNGVYNKYRISLEKIDKLPPIEKYVKKVDVFDKIGNLVGTYNTPAEAARAFGAKLSSVNRVLKGLANTTVGHIFKFH